MVLIFTNKEDSHPTPVIQHFNSWGVPFFRFNTECLLIDYEFKWWTEGANTDFYIKNKINGCEVYGHEVTAIWDRRPIPPSRVPLKCDDEIENTCLEEAHGFLSYLRYYLKDVFSIGSIVNDRYASSKMLQTRIALDSGFIVPKTMYSNKYEDLNAYFSRSEFLSVKPISVDSVYYENQEYVFYVNKHRHEDIFSQSVDAFSQTVSFIQEYIEKEYELRITVCCEEIVACRIDSQKQNSGEGKEDWRQGYDFGLQQKIVNIPDNLRSSCLSYLDKMGLNFGCFDIIVTPRGEYVFLECNPNGQWYWIELETGADISGIIARHLSNPISK